MSGWVCDLQHLEYCPLPVQVPPKEPGFALHRHKYSHKSSLVVSILDGQECSRTTHLNYIANHDKCRPTFPLVQTHETTAYHGEDSDRSRHETDPARFSRSLNPGHQLAEAPPYLQEYHQSVRQQSNSIQFPTIPKLNLGSSETQMQGFDFRSNRYLTERLIFKLW